MNDSDIDALGVRVIDSLCADLAPSLNDTEEDDGLLTMEESDPRVEGEELAVEFRNGDRLHPSSKGRDNRVVLEVESSKNMRCDLAIRERSFA